MLPCLDNDLQSILFIDNVRHCQNTDVFYKYSAKIEK